MDASVIETVREEESIKVGDIEKEKEIERRLRKLGLWENKRLLESRVATMLEDHIDEKDVLSRTLRNCRRRRNGEGGGGGGGQTAVEEIRKIISPRVIRDCYGQKLAYHVNILMGCFSKNIEHEVFDDVVIIRGSTAAVDDPRRLTKELRLELPPSLNMAALQISYAAGAVKIRVPYLLYLPPPLEKRSSESSDDRDFRFASISPIYSMNRQLRSANRAKLGSSGDESLSSDLPNSVTSLLSPPMTVLSDSPAKSSCDLQLQSPVLHSPTPSLPSPYPVFEDDTCITAVNASEEGKDLERCIVEPAMKDIVGIAPGKFEEVRYDGLTVISGKGNGVNGVTPSVVDSATKTALSGGFCHKSFLQDEFLSGADTFKTSNGICHSEKHGGQVIIEDNRNRSAVINDFKEDNATSKRTLIASSETVDAKKIDDGLGNNYLRNGTSSNMAAIYVNIADDRDRNTDESFDESPAIFKELKRPTEVTTRNERNAKYAPSSEELEENFINGRTENKSNFESGAKLTDKNGHRLKDTDLNDKSRSQKNDISKPTSDKTAFVNDYEDEKHFSLRHSGNKTTNSARGIPMLGYSFSNETRFSVLPRDDSGLSAQEKSCDEKVFKENFSCEEATEKFVNFDMVGEKEEQVSPNTNNYYDSGKVTPKDNSDNAWMNWSKGKNTSSFKQNHPKEEQEHCSINEDSDRDSTSNRHMMTSPRPQKPNKNLNSLFDSLEETML